MVALESMTPVVLSHCSVFTSLSLLPGHEKLQSRNCAVFIFSQYLAWAWYRVGTQYKFSNRWMDVLLSLLSLRSEGQGLWLTHSYLHITSSLRHECSVKVCGLSNEALCEKRRETSSVHTHTYPHTDTHRNTCHNLSSIQVQSLVEVMETWADNYRLTWWRHSRRTCTKHGGNRRWE